MPPIDRIILADLEVYYRVGVPDEERANPQRLLVSIEVERDLAAAARTDDLHQTVDYHDVARRLLRFGDGRSWKLIETLANDIAAMVLTDFKPSSVTVEVRKFPVPEARYVAVRITRPD